MATTKKDAAGLGAKDWQVKAHRHKTRWERKLGRVKGYRKDT